MQSVQQQRVHRLLPAHMRRLATVLNVQTPQPFRVVSNGQGLRGWISTGSSDLVVDKLQQVIGVGDKGNGIALKVHPLNVAFTYQVEFERVPGQIPVSGVRTLGLPQAPAAIASLEVLARKGHWTTSSQAYQAPSR